MTQIIICLSINLFLIPNNFVVMNKSVELLKRECKSKAYGIHQSILDSRQLRNVVKMNLKCRVAWPSDYTYI